MKQDWDIFCDLLDNGELKDADGNPQKASMLTIRELLSVYHGWLIENGAFEARMGE